MDNLLKFYPSECQKHKKGIWRKNIDQFMQNESGNQSRVQDILKMEFSMTECKKKGEMV